MYSNHCGGLAFEPFLLLIREIVIINSDWDLVSKLCNFPRFFFLFLKRQPFSFFLITWFFFVIFLFDASLEISAKSRRRRRRSLFDSQIYRKIVEMAILLCLQKLLRLVLLLPAFFLSFFERKTKINWRRRSWRPKLHKKVLSPEFLALPSSPFLHRKKVDFLDYSIGKPKNNFHLLTL